MNAPGDVTVELNRDYPSENWEELATDVGADSYSWPVTEPATTSARMRVYLTGTPTVGDTSDADFTIYGPPPAVTDLTIRFVATQNDSLDIEFNWTPSAEATGYRIYESLSPDVPGTEVGTTTAPPFAARVPAEAILRFYYVTALR
jgi:hypothetical protein